MSEDGNGVTMLMAIFGALLIAYGARLATTGNRKLLPARAMHSVRTSDDVRRIGRIVTRIGIIVLVAFMAVRLLLILQA